MIQLETVVISANKNETNRLEAPIVVHVMTPKLFENTNSVCLAQGLSFQPGLRVETNCQNCGFQQVRINGLDGVYIDVDSEEIKHINNYQIGIAEVLKCDYTPVTETGVQLLNGLQATAYCRIRYTAGNDFKRAARQREVIQAIEDQAKKADYDTLSKVFNSAIDDVYTSLDSKDILDLLANITKYRIVDEGGFPEETMRATGNIGAKGSSVVPLDLESNVVWLHQFLFDDANYTVTDSVKEYSRKIASDTAPYLNK